MTDLDNLIDEIHRGEYAGAIPQWATYEQAQAIQRSYHGSMDAAISFFDSAITTGGWVVSQHIAKVVMGEIESQQVFESVIPRNPARALLLSSLKALRSEQ